MKARVKARGIPYTRFIRETLECAPVTLGPLPEQNAWLGMRHHLG